MTDETTPKPPNVGGRPPHPSGINQMKKALRVLGNKGVSPIKGTTKAGRALKVWRAEWVADLGGEAELTTQKRAVIELALRTRLILDSVDNWLLQQPSLVNKSARALFPVVLQRQQLADALVRYLTQLGLERKAHDAGDIAGILARMPLQTKKGSATDPEDAS
jgi:hypothetical protein